MLVVLSFAAVEQLIEGHGRYKVAVYPFYFMLVPYICVWFERENSLYVRIGGLFNKLNERRVAHEY